MRFRRWVGVGGAVVVAGYCWFAAGLRPFTVPIEVAVAAPAVVITVLSWRWRPRGEQLAAAPPGRSRTPWVALFIVLAVWEVANYFLSPRRDHPTLSSIADSFMGTHAGRAALFALWLLLGWALFGPTRTTGDERDRDDRDHRDERVMRNATFAGYAVIALVAVALEVAGVRLVPVLRHLTRRGPWRVLLLLGWAWLGWHLFVRGMASFLR